MGTLGSGVNTAAIYAKGGQALLLPLPDNTGVEWGRTRNGISTAAVNISLNTASAECCRDLGNVHVWAHELVIFRDGKRVWEGPVRRKEDGANSVVIRSTDVWGWSQRRRIHTARVTAVNNPVTTEGLLSVQRAYAPEDPNVLTHVQVLTDPGQVQIMRDVQVNSGYYADDLDALAGQGLNYTVLGRRIILWPDEVTLGRTQMLNWEADTATDASIVEDGDDVATTWVAAGENDTFGTASVVDTYYGPLDRIEPSPGVSDVPSLDAISGSALEEVYPAPFILEVPDGAALNCDAPITIEDLVPGTLVPVESNGTCRRVRATMILQDVKVTHPGGGTESVTITLAPVSAAAE